MQVPKIEDFVERLLKESSYRENPYFVNLRNGNFTKEDFVETQIQFFYAVVFFSRPMAALAAKIPVADLRLEILKNVWEEHGSGEKGRFHANTFLVLLERLAKLKLEDVESRALWPEVRAFNTLLAGSCILDEHLIGVGVLGMIERMFADISYWIGTTIVARKWLTEDQIIHYNLHQELDIKHSRDFFNVLAPAWNANPDNLYFIEQGLRMGEYIFNSLYRGLYEARGTRRLTEHRGPQSRVY